MTIERLTRVKITLQPGLPAQANGNDIVYDQRTARRPILPSITKH
jgi:hypothetical protein